MNERVLSMELKLVLYELSRLMKSRGGSVSLSSSDLGRVLGVSQQTASRRIIQLEKNGFILRRGREIQLTDKGIKSLEGIYFNLRDFLESRDQNRLRGKIITGIGEGAYYVREYSLKISGEIGFEPFYGTLNIKLDENTGLLDRRKLSEHATHTIKEFRKEGRTYGGVKLAPVMLRVIRKKLNLEKCYIIIPERTHHEDELELISEHNLRRKYDLKDGEDVEILFSGG